MPFTVRPGTPSDAATVARLINELASYERLSSESHPDPATLGRHMSEVAGPRVEVALAIDTESSEAIGFALFLQNYSTFLTQWGIYLEDLYVRPEYRGRGVGKALFQTVAREAIDRGCDRFEWSVLNWNDLAIAFYGGLGALPMLEWTTWRLSGQQLKEAAGLE